MLKPVIKKLTGACLTLNCHSCARSCINVGAIEIKRIVIEPSSGCQAGCIGAELKIDAIRRIAIRHTARHISPI